MQQNARLVVREVNAAILELEERFGRNGHAPVLCECGAEGCLQRLHVPTDVYEAIRAEAQRFVIAPGHERAGGERVTAEEADYLVVAANAADELAPQAA